MQIPLYAKSVKVTKSTLFLFNTVYIWVYYIFKSSADIEYIYLYKKEKMMQSSLILNIMYPFSSYCIAKYTQTY